MTEYWTTLCDPAHLADGYDPSTHHVWFWPLSERQGGCVGFLIPELETQIISREVDRDGDLVTFILGAAPGPNHTVEYWLPFACQRATEDDCPLMFACETREQADQAAALAAKLLPNHRRIPLERMYEPASRTFKALQ